MLDAFYPGASSRLTQPTGVSANRQ